MKCEEKLNGLDLFSGIGGISIALSPWVETIAYCENDRYAQPFSTDLLEGDTWDEYASFLCRVDNGVPHRSYRLKCCGNSVVPVQVRTAFKKLIGATI